MDKTLKTIKSKTKDNTKPKIKLDSVVLSDNAKLANKPKKTKPKGKTPKEKKPKGKTPKEKKLKGKTPKKTKPKGKTPKEKKLKGKTKEKPDTCIPKKRGRKPNKSYGFKKTSFKQNPIDDESIIIHLPIKDLGDSLKEIDNLLNYSPNINTPEPLNDDTHLSFIKYETVHIADPKTQNNIPAGPTMIYDDSGDHTVNNIKTARRDQLENLEKVIKKNTLSKTLIQFNESNKNGTWPDQTTISCWWCTYKFTGTPCGLPINCYDDKYTMLGVFCSPECSASYNFNTINNTDIWEKYALLNLLYGGIYKKQIRLAPDRNTLKRFGGCLTIDQFRSQNSNSDCDFKINMPPMKSIIPHIEYSSRNTGFSASKKQPVDIERFKLKRNKPFNKNTLEECMNIIKI